LILRSNPFLLSYEAAEDNEISFLVGDKIVEIEEVGEGWWQGKNPHGDFGMFPGMFLLVACLEKTN
jgi:hypothetical protein